MATKRPKKPTSKKPAANPQSVRISRMSKACVRRESGRDWAPAYFRHLELCAGHRTKAARLAEVDYSTVWERRKTDAVFADREKQIVQLATDMLEDEAMRRAYEGVETVHMDGKGNVRMVRVEYSDTLLLRILETRRPEWRPKSNVDVTSGGAPMHATKAERDAALEEARRNREKPLD